MGDHSLERSALSPGGKSPQSPSNESGMEMTVAIHDIPVQSMNAFSGHQPLHFRQLTNVQREVISKYPASMMSPPVPLPYTTVFVNTQQEQMYSAQSSFQRVSSETPTPRLYVKQEDVSPSLRPMTHLKQPDTSEDCYSLSYTSISSTGPSGSTHECQISERDNRIHRKSQPSLKTTDELKCEPDERSSKRQRLDKDENKELNEEELSDDDTEPKHYPQIQAPAYWGSPSQTELQHHSSLSGSATVVDEPAQFACASVAAIGRPRKQIGQYTPEVRREKIQKYQSKKRKRRNGGKTGVKYICRQRFAVARPRKAGRFVKTTKTVNEIMVDYNKKQKQETDDEEASPKLTHIPSGVKTEQPQRRQPQQDQSDESGSSNVDISVYLTNNSLPQVLKAE